MPLCYDENHLEETEPSIRPPRYDSCLGQMRDHSCTGVRVYMCVCVFRVCAGWRAGQDYAQLAVAFSGG